MINIFGTYGITYEVDSSHFPDGTLNIKLPNEDIHAVEWLYENDAELFTLICIKRHYDNLNPDIQLNLLLPYIPHARMDRAKNPDDVFTLKYFCEIINSLNFNEVYVLDAHSSVSLGLLERVREIPIRDSIQEAINRLMKSNNLNDEDLVLFFPDEGSMKRYSSLFLMPHTFGIKKRDWATGKILGLKVMHPEVLEGKHVLIIDDICSMGGTFYHSAKKIKEYNPLSINLYITHAENTMIRGEMYNTENLINKIYTVQTIFDKNLDVLNKVDIIQNY